MCERQGRTRGGEGREHSSLNTLCSQARAAATDLPATPALRAESATDPLATAAKLHSRMATARVRAADGAPTLPYVNNFLGHGEIFRPSFVFAHYTFYTPKNRTDTHKNVTNAKTLALIAPGCKRKHCDDRARLLTIPKVLPARQPAFRIHYETRGNPVNRDNTNSSPLPLLPRSEEEWKAER